MGFPLTKSVAADTDSTARLEALDADPTVRLKRRAT
jgi:hypothetical protein